MSRANELFEKDIEDFQKTLGEINVSLKKQTSHRWSFWHGVFYGFGVFIGSVMLVAVLVYVLTFLKIDGNTFLGSLIHKIIDAATKKAS